MSRCQFSRLPIPMVSALTVLLFLPPGLAQERPPAAPKPVYRLAGVDVFGNSRTPAPEILATLGVEDGAEINPDVVTKLDGKLRSGGKFAYSKVSSTNYGDLKCYLTVDVVEKGEEHRFRFNPPPAGRVEVPPNVLDWVRKYIKASVQQSRINPRGLTDINEGHYLSSDAGLRDYEQKILEMVPANYDALARCLKEDQDPEKRALCALLLGWAKDKKGVVQPLESALRDPDVHVRENAARSLIPIAYLAVHNHFPFPLEPLFDQVHYPTSSDRSKATAVLLHLAGDAANHKAILENAGDVLMKMIDARHPTQSNHALTLLTLVSGEKFGRDTQKWKSWWTSRTRTAPAPAKGARSGSTSS